MIFVPFDKSILEDQQNPNLADELMKELPGIFNWAIEGMRQLKEQDHFIIPQRCREAIEEYRRDTNPAKVFLEENVERADDCNLPAKALYDYYWKWCKYYGYKPLGNANFGKEIKRHFPWVKKKHPADGAKRYWVYADLKMMEKAEATTDDICGEKTGGR